MLTLSQIEILSELNEMGNVNEFVECLLKEYAKTEDGVAKLFQLIPLIATDAIYRKQEKVIDYKKGMEALIAERMEKDSEQRTFISMLYACKVYFPDGNADKYSECDKNFFEEFIQKLKSGKYFDFRKSEDMSWAEMMGLKGWIVKVVRGNIDKDFMGGGKNGRSDNDR